jgi:hypothetical protein
MRCWLTLTRYWGDDSPRLRPPVSLAPLLLFSTPQVSDAAGGPLRDMRRGDFVKVLAESSTSMTLRGRALCHVAPNVTA